MASQNMREATPQELWDDTITRLLNLSTATIKRNSDLESRVSELELEISVWKQAHAVLLESSEREAKAHNVQVASLNRQISGSEYFKTQNPLLLCVIDGEQNIFLPSLIMQGHQGGWAAAQHLTKGIAEYLAKEDIHIFGRLSFWVSLYYDRTRLIGFLEENQLCTAEQFDAFLAGFSHASPRFTLIDVGMNNNDVEIKVREYLQTYIRFPQTLRMFYCGGHESSVLDTLESDQIGKLVLLTTPGEMPHELQKHALPYVSIDGLFIEDKLALQSRLKKLSPMVATVTGFSSVTINGGLISPQSPFNCNSKLVDPSLPLHKQVPPPCNEHYLMSCSKGASCKYSHDYILSPEQLASLATNAKKAPCNWLKNGLTCPYGDKCCWGHVCPNGPKCYHLSKGKCWFKGESMHDLQISPTSTGSPRSSFGQSPA